MIQFKFFPQSHKKTQVGKIDVRIQRVTDKHMKLLFMFGRFKIQIKVQRLETLRFFMGFLSCSRQMLK
jgi:hypothetical protein